MLLRQYPAWKVLSDLCSVASRNKRKCSTEYLDQHVVQVGPKMRIDRKVQLIDCAMNFNTCKFCSNPCYIKFRSYRDNYSPNTDLFAVSYFFSYDFKGMHLVLICDICNHPLRPCTEEN